MASSGVGASKTRSDAALQALAELTSALAKAETVQQICQRGLHLVERALGVRRGSVLLCDADGIMRFRTWSGISDDYRAATEGHSPWEMGALDAEPLVVADVLEDAALEPLRDVIAGEGIRGLVFVPISYERRVLGKYMLYYSEPASLDPGELELARVVADQIALAVKRQQDEDELRASRDQLTAVLEAVSDGVTVQRPDGHLAYANSAAALSLGFETPEHLLAADLSDVMRDVEMLDEHGTRLPASRLPGRQVLRGAPSAERVIRYRSRSTSEERVSLVRATPVRGEDGSVRLVVNVVRDVTQERRERLWQELLADSSTILTSSLRSEDAYARVTELAVPRVADWCALSVPQTGGPPRLVALSHRDGERRRRALELRERYPGDDRENGTAWVLETGDSVLVERVSDEMLVEAALSDEHLELIRGLELGSVMTVPLTARGRTLAAMTFATRAGERSYRRADLEQAEEFGRRAGLALDNARLFEEQRERERRIREAHGRADFVAEVSEVLGQSFDYDRTLDTVARLAVPTLADYCFFDLLDLDGERELERVAAAHKDIGPFADRVRPFVPSAQDARHPIRRALTSGRPVFVRRVDDAWIRSVAVSEEHAGFMREQQVSAVISVPVAVGRRRLGVLTLMATGDRSYDTADVDTAQELARRAAIAIDQARLFERVEASLVREREARERAQSLERNATRLAAAVTVFEVAAITVEDLASMGFDIAAVVECRDDRLEILSSIGLPESAVKSTEYRVSSEVATADAMRTGRAVVLQSAAEYEARYADGTDVLRRSGAETIACLPLRAADGRIMGAVSAAARTPGWLDEPRHQLLTAFVEQCGLALERARLFEAEHEVAVTLQRSLLPRSLPTRDALELAALYRPAGQGLNVGGDWYDALELLDGRIALVVGDVVGHGLDAATVMGELRNTMRPFLLDGLEPHEVLRRLNAVALHADGRASDGQSFATAAIAVLDASLSRIALSSAGHPPPLLVSPGEEPRFLEPGQGPPVGAVDAPDYTTSIFDLERGSTLVLYTDGLVERRGAPLQDGLQALAGTAARWVHEPVSDFCSAVVSSVLQDGDPADDVAVLAARLTAAPVFRRRVRARPDQLAPLRRALREWLETIGADEETVYDVTLATSEAVANAVEHPIGQTSGFVFVEAVVVDESVEVRVRDSGRWREPGPPRLRGRGVRLIEGFMDDLRFERTPESTQVYMRRNLRRRT